MTGGASSLPRLAIVSSRFNAEIVDGLLAGALAALAEDGLAVPPADRFTAEGAFELPLLARSLAGCGRYDGVICLGCVIKGDTAHFEFIGLAASLGIMAVSLTSGIPIAFGVLTTYTEEQARLRSADDGDNKGREAARACIECARTLARLRQPEG
jgi:6,7-dimethyl-8-ribityllumazine synthase